MRFIPTSKRNPCPVCLGTDGDCRHLDSGLVLCHKFPDRDANIDGWIWKKPSRCGVWGIFAPKGSDGSVHDEIQRQRWRERAEALERERLSSFCKALSPIERDEAIKEILNQLRLTGQDRQTLSYRKHLEDEAIEEFCSVIQWQELSRFVTPRLAGVHASGYRLMNPRNGILVPVKDENGLFVALRLHNPEALPKYTWLSSRKFGITPHFSNGENPIGVYYPRRYKCYNKIGLAEGLEFKARIAANRLGYPVIGFGGCNFGGSPETLRSAIANIKEKLDRQEQQSRIKLVLLPDGGSLFNEKVYRQYIETLKLLDSWGLGVDIAWWNQLQKTDGDIDEIDDRAISNIEYLSPDEFREIAAEAQYKQKVGKTQQALHTLTYQPNLLANQKYLPDLVDLVPETGILAIKAHKGSGKSAQIQKLISHFRGLGKDIISITPRIALGREQAQRWGLEWGGDIDTYGMSKTTVLEHSSGFGLCWDSIWRIAHKDWSNSVVIIDESEMGVGHLLNSSTCKDRRSQILKTFESKISECLAGKGLVILADADLTNISIDYVLALAPEGTKVFTVVNKALPDAWDIDFLTGRPDETIEQIFEAVEEGERLAISTDSQIEAEALDRCLAERFPDKKIIRIDRKTTETNFGRDFVTKPNESIRSERPDVLIFTPSMGVGVSIDVKWFDKVFGLFYGVLEPSQCRQALARVRDGVPRVVWASEASHFDESCKSFLPETINKNFHKYHDRGLQLIELAAALATGDDPADLVEAMQRAIDPLTRQWNNPHIDTYCKLKARRNFGLSQLAIQLRQELIDEGHTITDFGCLNLTASGGKISIQKGVLKAEEAASIANADDISLEQAKSIVVKAGATEEERHQATKALLKAELPDIELTPEFVGKAIINDRRRWLDRVKLWWYFTNFEKTKELDRREWRHKLKQFATGVAYLPDVKTFSPKVELIKDLGLFAIIDLSNLEKEYTSSDRDIATFKQKANFLRYRLYTVFNLTVTPKTDPIKLIGKLLERVGLGLISRQVRVGDERIRYYKIDLKLLCDTDRMAVLRALDTKYSQIEQGISLEDVTGLANNLNIQASPVTPSVHTTLQQGTTEISGNLDSLVLVDRAEAVKSEERSRELESQNVTLLRKT